MNARLRFSLRAAAKAALAVVIVLGCTSGTTVPPSAMTLGVMNSTTIPIDIVVDGKQFATLMPGESREAIPSNALPPLPWNVEARNGKGRVLLTLNGRDGDVTVSSDGQGQSQKGVGSRVDLSCGRIDIWSGPPLAGPAPGPGTPGDCE